MTAPPLPVDDEDRICGNCRRLVHLDDCDDCGACPGAMFCRWCGEQIDTATGETVNACGSCVACLTMKE